MTLRYQPTEAPPIKAVRALDHKIETLWRWSNTTQGMPYGSRKAMATASMRWPDGVRSTDLLIDAGYCLDAPVAIPQGCMNLPAYGAGCVLRDRAFA